MNLAGLRNDLARRFICWGMRQLGPYAHRKAMREVSEFKHTQAILRERYDIEATTPCTIYDDELRARIAALPNVEWVKTSGSTREPKIIAFDKARLNKVKKSFAGVTLRSAAAINARRPIIFTLASLSDDESFTAIMTNKTPSQFDLWVTPHRALALPEVRALTSKYSVHALRLWGLVLSNPGWLYSTNPSTQAGFFHALSTAWETHTQLLRDFIQEPSTFSNAVHHAARQIVSSGWRERAAVVLNSATPLPPTTWLNLEAYCSWDGGNTAPFLRQLEKYLSDVDFIPMFSMSTETLETLTVYHEDTVSFLTIAPGVYYEFLAEGAADEPQNLIPAVELKPGERYVMVVSDPYGLRRYVTEDVFLCNTLVEGVPDLRFLYRRGLTWSYTGEKLTGEQLGEVYDELVRHFEPLRTAQLTTAPTHPDGQRLPGYTLLLATPGSEDAQAQVQLSEVAKRFDALLGDINDEYASKRNSQRLHPPTARWIEFDHLASKLRGENSDTQNRDWDSQFKLLPLLRKTLEELNL